MNKSIRPLIAAAALTAALAFTARAEEPGFVDFGKLNPSGENQFVEVNIKSNLIAMVANLAKQAEPEVAEIINGLKQVRVNVLGITKENREDLLRKVTTIREKLDKTGWERIVTAIDKDQDVGVYLKLKDAKTVDGLCVTVYEKNQVVLVNIVGNLQPEKLAMVGERFNVEPLKHIPSRPSKNHDHSDKDHDKEKEKEKSAEKDEPKS